MRISMLVVIWVAFRRENRVEQASGLLDPATSENLELEGLEAELKELLPSHRRNALLYYVQGLVLSDR